VNNMKPEQKPNPLAMPFPLSELNHLIRALNGANAAMRKYHKGTGLEGVRNHFELVEHGSHLPHTAKKTVKTRGGDGQHRMVVETLSR
jgi:hypothetical protein